jgi:Polysaccharide deacetylase
MKKYILLTFDLEEFDLPLEFNISIDRETQLEVSTTGLQNLLTVLRHQNIQATFFTTAYYAENNPALIRQLVSEGHEIASHLYYHSEYKTEHLLQSKQTLESITRQQITGIRIPRLKQFSCQAIRDAGYLYDSSLNPTYLPGRYNHLTKPRKLFRDAESSLFIVPMSVSPLLRIPLFWLSFKNMYLSAYMHLCNRILNRDHCLHLYFHPWEFTELDQFKLPWYIQRRSGKEMADRLDHFIGRMKSNAEFMKVTDYLCKKSSSFDVQLKNSSETQQTDSLFINNHEHQLAGTA